MRELELKFTVDAKRAAAVDAALRRLPSEQSTIESHYHDTVDRRLAEAGLSLRLRKTGRAWEQTLKAGGESVVDRHEETVPRPGRWGPQGPPIDIRLHTGSIAGALLEAALKGRESTGAALRPMCTSRIRRRTIELDACGARIEIAFDRGVIVAAGASTPVCEVEYELKSGDARALVQVARAGVLEHGLWLSTISKFARGDRLARGAGRGPAIRAEPPRLDAAMSGAEIEQAVLRSCLDQVLANASEVASGQFDEESAHQLRVGLRRTRTAARELGALSALPDSQWEDQLTGAFRALGVYRDRETVARSLQARLTTAGSPEPTLPPPAAAVPDPVAVVRDPGVQCALLEVLGSTLGPALAQGGAGVRKDAADADVGHTMRRIRSRLGKLDRELKPMAKAFEALDDSARHRVRKRLKRLRYLAELVGPLFDHRQVGRYLERLRPAQDALGTHNDLVVGLRMAQEAVDRGDAKAWFNVGWLTAARTASATRCAKALARAAQARRFW